MYCVTLFVVVYYYRAWILMQTLRQHRVDRKEWLPRRPRRRRS